MQIPTNLQEMNEHRLGGRHRLGGGALQLGLDVPYILLWSPGGGVGVIFSVLRAVPEIILGGATFFFQTPPPPGHTWSQSPPDPQDT